MRLNRNGTILMASLWILAILSILAVGIGFRVSLELRLSRDNMDRLKALYLAKAGVVKAQERLFKDTSNYDSIYECGITLSSEEKSDPGEFNAVFSVSLGDGSFSVGYSENGKSYIGMSDEERKININKIDIANKKILENILINSAKERPLSGPEASEIAASIIDWRDEDEEFLDGGAEKDYYQSLEFPYDCKNGDFSAIEELLLVKGMTREIFNDLKDYVTVNGDGKVNMNTASNEVMHAVAGAIPLIEDTINAIIVFRNGTDGILSTQDDGIFDSGNMTTILSLPGIGLTPGEITKVTNSFTTTSNYFRIESRGVVERAKMKKRIICVAKRGTGENLKLISYREQ